jgi:hypothetical protein
MEFKRGRRFGMNFDFLGLSRKFLKLKLAGLTQASQNYVFLLHLFFNLKKKNLNQLQKMKNDFFTCAK